MRPALTDLGLRWGGVVVLGVVLGIASAQSDTVAGSIDQSPVARATSMVLNAGVVWAGLAVLAGWIVRSRRPAAIAGALSLWCAVAGYYAWGVVAGDRVAGGFGGVSRVVEVWAVAAIVLGPALGVVGALIRQRGLIGFVAWLVLPVGALAEVFAARPTRSGLVRCRSGVGVVASDDCGGRCVRNRACRGPRHRGGPPYPEVVTSGRGVADLPIMDTSGLPTIPSRLAAMRDGPSSWKLGWAVGAVFFGLWTFLSVLGAGVSLVSGNMAGLVFGLAWALCGYWFTRGMVERARPAM